MIKLKHFHLSFFFSDGAEWKFPETIKCVMVSSPWWLRQSVSVYSWVLKIPQLIISKTVMLVNVDKCNSYNPRCIGVFNTFKSVRGPKTRSLEHCCCIWMSFAFAQTEPPLGPFLWLHPSAKTALVKMTHDLHSWPTAGPHSLVFLLPHCSLLLTLPGWFLLFTPNLYRWC